MWPFNALTKKGRLSGGPTPLNYVTAAQWDAGFGDGLRITPQAAENIAAVLAAVNAISETIAALPAYVVRVDDDSAEPVTNHPLARLIKYGPNENQTWSDFISGFLASALLRGNGLAEIGTDTTGRLSSLTFCAWQYVSPWQAEDGALRFDFTPTIQPGAGQRRTFLREDVLFIADRSDNGLVGVPRLQRAAGAMRAALELQEASTQFSMNATRPSGYMTAPQRLDDATALRLKGEWQSNYSGKGKGLAAVLGSGLEWKHLAQFSPEDMSIVGLKNFTVADISRVFGVPPFILADPSRATFASAREATRHFYSLSLVPWIVKLERAFTATVLGDGFRLMLDADELTRGALEDRWNAWAKARAAGVLSPNDVRIAEGWPTHPDGDSIAPPSTAKPATEDDKPEDGEEDKPKPGEPKTEDPAEGEEDPPAA
jgi:HK97 family phage portal protein